MIDPANVPPVEDDEVVARFVLQSRYVRGDQTVRPDAFMPPANRELSVTRHLLASDVELWHIGHDVAAATHKTLYGRADVVVRHYVRSRLSVVAAALPENPNHANVVGWPVDKAHQKNIAQQVAATARYVASLALP